MSKKVTLASALQQATSTSSDSISISSETSSDQPSQTKIQANRQGKKAITGWFDPAVSRQLKRLALDKDTTIQELMREALNDLFQKYKNNPIA